MISQISRGSEHAQVSVKEGVKRYCNIAVEVLLKELSQIDSKHTFIPVLIESLSLEEKRTTLNLWTIINKKWCGKIKGRVVAYGRKQKKHIPREDTMLPTVKLESLLVSIMIDAKEERDVATADM